MAAGDVSRTFNFRDDGRVGAERCRFDHPAGEAATDDALDNQRFIKTNLTFSVVDGHPAANAGAGRAAINFTFGKNTDVAAVGVVAERGIDKDGSV